MNAKTKGGPTYYHCGKLGHIENICKSKNGEKNPKPKFTSNYFNCKKQGHQEECRLKVSNTLIIPRFEGYFYNC